MQIKTGNEMKYLGVIIDNRLTFIPHIKQITNKAEKFLNKLQGIIKNTKGPNKEEEHILK